MKTLNGDAARILAQHGVAGCTDITGSSLLGHGLELATKSGVGLRLRSASAPLVAGAAEAADAGVFPGGTKRNRAAFEGSVRFAAEVTERTRALPFSPETSGGLLAAVRRGLPPAPASYRRGGGCRGGSRQLAPARHDRRRLNAGIDTGCGGLLYSTRKLMRSGGLHGLQNRWLLMLQRQVRFLPLP